MQNLQPFSLLCVHREIERISKLGQLTVDISEKCLLHTCPEYEIDSRVTRVSFNRLTLSYYI